MSVCVMCTPHCNNMCVCVCVCGPFNKVPTFLVQAFNIYIYIMSCIYIYIYIYGGFVGFVNE